MKIKIPTKKSKKEQKEEGPLKGFEEFNIDKDVLDELDAISESNGEEEVKSQKNEEIIEEVEIIDEKEAKQEIVDAASSEFINIVRDNINICAKEIKDVSETMQKIEAQKNSESFWKKGENIRTISKYVNKMSEVQQKTLDLLVMFLGASGKMADDYDTILKTIDELGELNGGEVEVLNYLLKIKKMVKEIKSNDERLKALMYDNEQLKVKVDTLEKTYKEKVANYEKDYKITVSKLHRLQARTGHLSIFILIAYILIIILGVVIYIKVFR